MGLAAQKQGGEKESEDTVVFRLRGRDVINLTPYKLSTSSAKPLNPKP